jgi:hypothetical protein
VDDERLRTFLAELADRTGTRRLEVAEADAVLDLARVAAHQEERPFAPLTTYVAGLALGSPQEGDSQPRAEKIRALIDIVRELDAR